MDEIVREHIAKALAWKDAHATFDDAVEGLPAAQRGQRVEGFPHTMWQLVEHVRIAQADLLDFSRNPTYQEMEWPGDYWPKEAGPADEREWRRSVERVREDREELARLARDTAIDLTARIPHGSGQTYLRELLLAADHTAYHVGQMVVLRRLLGSWQ
jgi:uncharacterized damage-inducible protein DinB